MWYDVASKPFKLALNESLRMDTMQAGLPDALVELGDDMFKLEHHGEGFWLDELEPYLSLATEPQVVTVHIADHKGTDSFQLEFGPGYCQET